MTHLRQILLLTRRPRSKRFNNRLNPWIRRRRLSSPLQPQWYSVETRRNLHGDLSLTTPTAADAQAFLILMNGREGSVLTSLDDNDITSSSSSSSSSESASLLQKYNADWTRKYQGRSTIVLRPQSTQEVSSILKYCNERRIAVVPQAGNTGLVGGSVPIETEVVLSVEKLNTIQGLDETTGILKCDAGCILQTLQEFAADRGHLVPVDLGAKGTCQIGGNVSTNAGGSYYFRYKSLHANVLGLEVVLADGGRILDLSYSSANLKDNTGYDMKHLFIGAEGTLGIVTKVALQCPRLPQSRCAAFLACESFEHVTKLLQEAKSHLGEILAAFEFMDASILKIVESTGKELPLSDVYPYNVLIETHGSLEEHDQAKLEKFLDLVLEDGMVVDGILAQNYGQVNEFWNVRESCNPSIASSGYVYKYDVSLPVEDFPSFSEEMHRRLAPVNSNIVTANWGHCADGNLHFNAVVPNQYEKDPELLSILEPHIFESVLKRGGSISAEHGLGQQKNKYLTMVHDEGKLESMRAIKQLFDPNGILNPFKFLPSTYHA